MNKHIHLASLHKITTYNLLIYGSHNPENLTFFLFKFNKKYTSLKIIFHVIDMMYSNGCHSCDPNTVNVIYKACTVYDILQILIFQQISVNNKSISELPINFIYIWLCKPFYAVLDLAETVFCYNSKQNTIIVYVHFIWFGWICVNNRFIKKKN